jgi:hypothetical protein
MKKKKKKQTKSRVRAFEPFVARLDESGLRADVAARALVHRVSLRELYDGPDGAPSITAARRAVYLWLVEEGKGLNEIARLFDRAVSGVSRLVGGRDGTA